MIGPGDTVVALLTGGRSDDGLPFVVPVAGEVYTITSVYEAKYGLGCTLEGLDPYPFKGFFLAVRPGIRMAGRPIPGGWYFQKLQPFNIKHSMEAAHGS